MKLIDSETLNKVNTAFDQMRSIQAVVDSFAGVLPKKAVRDVLGPRRHEQIITRTRAQKFDDDTIVDMVAKADIQGVTTAAGYREWRNTETGETPSLALIIRRFGSWNAAREAAECSVITKRHSRGELKTWTDHDIKVFFAGFIKEARANYEMPTPAAYDVWSRKTANAPLLSTLRVRLSTQRQSWADLVRECEELLKML